MLALAFALGGALGVLATSVLVLLRLAVLLLARLRPYTDFLSLLEPDFALFPLDLLLLGVVLLDEEGGVLEEVSIQFQFRKPLLDQVFQQAVVGVQDAAVLDGFLAPLQVFLALVQL